MNFFIIGNGFDIAHKMKTRYSDFRKFLVEKYFPEGFVSNSICEIPYTNEEDEYDEKDVVSAIINILDSTEKNYEEWNDVESSLGNLDYSPFLDTYGLFEGEQVKETYYRNESCAQSLCRALSYIDDLFQDWLSTIEHPKNGISGFKNIIDKDNDLFLTFNYTKTLEVIYNVKNICHIHGMISEKIYWGHGKNKYDTDSIQRKWFGAENYINKLQNKLKKDTQGAFLKNISFFRKLNIYAKREHMNIYSFGFSFSDVDLYYLKEIFSILETKNIKFHLYNFGSKETIDKYKNKILECGFKGEILIFDL